jgi:hypothetical protein
MSLDTSLKREGTEREGEKERKREREKEKREYQCL